MRRLTSGAALAVLGLIGCGERPPPAAKPELLLMTSLPLRSGEASMRERLQEGGGAPAPAFTRLQSRYSIRSLDELEQLDRTPPAVLLLAQPRALSPTELVSLDRWLRAGGRALILADPALVWPSDYPIGDARRPLFTSLLSPLLAHWGIELVMPVDEQGKRVMLTLGDRTIETAAAGQFARLPAPGEVAADCALKDHDRAASCWVGKGRAILLADADLLDARFWQHRGAALGPGDARDNMIWIESALAELGQ